MELKQGQRPAQHPRPAQEMHGGLCAQCGKPVRAPRAELMDFAAVPAAPARSESAPNAALRTHFAAYAQEYTLRLPAEKDAAISLPLRQQRIAGGFHAGGNRAAETAASHCAAVIPAEGYYICLWETGVTRVEGAAALELGVNESGSILAERLEPVYYSGQQYTWFHKGDCVTLRLRTHADQPGTGALVEGSAAQLTLIRLG